MGILFGVGCAAQQTISESQLLPPDPKDPDLKAIFLSLPDYAVADMSLAGRRKFLEDEAKNPSGRFDPVNRFVDYFSDSNDGTGASSRLHMKVLLDADGGYVVVIHMPKAYAGIGGPQDNDTYIFRPAGSGWTDVTEDLLPKQVSRSWYFQPHCCSTIVEAGPYLKKKGNDGSDVWEAVRQYDLNWTGTQFECLPSARSRFSL